MYIYLHMYYIHMYIYLHIYYIFNIYILITYLIIFMWTILKVFIEFLTASFLFYVSLFWPQGMWDFSSLTKDWTCTPYIGRQSLNHWTASKVPRIKIKLSLWLRGKELASARKCNRGWRPGCTCPCPFQSTCLLSPLPVQQRKG